MPKTKESRPTIQLGAITKRNKRTTARRSGHALWQPLYLEPMLGSGERICVGVLVVGHHSHQIAVVPDLGRFEAVYGKKKSDYLIKLVEIMSESADDAFEKPHSYERFYDTRRRSHVWRSPFDGLYRGPVQCVKGRSLDEVARMGLMMCASLWDDAQKNQPIQSLTQHEKPSLEVNPPTFGVSLPLVNPMDGLIHPEQIPHVEYNPHEEAMSSTILDSHMRQNYEMGSSIRQVRGEDAIAQAQIRQEVKQFVVGLAPKLDHCFEKQKKLHIYDFAGQELVANFAVLRPNCLREDTGYAVSSIWALGELRSNESNGKRHKSVNNIDMFVSVLGTASGKQQESAMQQAIKRLEEVANECHVSFFTHSVEDIATAVVKTETRSHQTT